MVEGGHHGGAWKVAYADFVTAMMAFFLLMWLLNATTEDQRKGLAEFSPNNLLSRASSGSGQPFGGHTPFDKGAMPSDRGSVQVLVGNRPVPQDDDDDQEVDAHGQSAQDKPSPPGGPAAEPAAAPAAVSSASPNPGAQPERGAAQEILSVQPAKTPSPPGASNAPGASSASNASSEPDNSALTETKAEQARRERRERRAFEQAAQQINDAVRGDPALADLARQLSVDMTPEGLRIQIMDEERQPMFATGSAALNDRAACCCHTNRPM